MSPEEYYRESRSADMGHPMETLPGYSDTGPAKKFLFVDWIQLEPSSVFRSKKATTHQEGINEVSKVREAHDGRQVRKLRSEGKRGRKE